MMSARQTSEEEVPESKYGSVTEHSKSPPLTQETRMEKVTYS